MKKEQAQIARQRAKLKTVPAAQLDEKIHQEENKNNPTLRASRGAARHELELGREMPLHPLCSVGCKVIMWRGLGTSGEKGQPGCGLAFAARELLQSIFSLHLCFLSLCIFPCMC